MKKRVVKTQLQQGFSLIEVIVAAAILSTVTIGASSFQSAMMQKTTRNNDKSFASEKALQMYDEMRSFVQSNQESFITSLDNFSDGNGYGWSLTTSSKDIANPADPLSGNKQIDSKWRFVRQIQVDPVLNDDYARQVRVKVWRADPNDHTKPMGQPLAAISGVLKTNVDQYPPTQVYDVFMFAAENAPAWWVDIAALRPTFERLLDDLEYRNPGLRYRRHYVSRMGYGRDPFYLPYMNSSANSNAQTIPWTYFYPGRIARTNSGLPIKESYVEDYMNGRRRNDDPSKFTHANRTLTSSSVPYRHYAMADRFNHIKRYPENSAMLKRMRSIDPNTDVDLVTYLEEMNSDPDQYRNSLIINLHGELVPFPAIRNYSDPAKSPENFPNQRLVTHPESIRYDNDTTQMNLRVHAFQSLPYGEEKLDGDNLTADTESNASSSDNKSFILNNTMEKISVFIPTDSKGRNPFNPLSAGFLDHPDANISVEQALASLSPSKIIGNHRRPYTKKTYIGNGNYPLGAFTLGTAVFPSTLPSLEDRRRFYRKTTDHDTVGLRRTIEIGRDPRLASDVSYVRGGISSETQFSDLKGANPSITLSRNDFAYLGSDRTDQGKLTQTLNELIDQTVILDPNIINPRNGSSIHVGMNLELRVRSVQVTGSTGEVRLYFYNEPTRITNEIQNYTNSLPTPRLKYGRNALAIAATPDLTTILGNDTLLRTTLLAEINNVALQPPLAGTVDVVDTALNRFRIGTRIVLKRDFEVMVNPSVYGKTVNGIHVMLLDTPTRHMQKESSSVFPIWNEAGTSTFGGQYGGLYHAKGDANEDAHQDGDTRRLYRTEYIPAPVNKSGTNTISDDFNSDLTSTSQYNAKNTARWVLGFNLSELNATSGNAFNGEMISVETRIASGATDVSSVLEQGQSEDGDVYQPNVSASSTENKTAMRNNIYNVSRTFVWTGAPNSNYDTALENAKVPYVERREYLGDPRYMPYADLKAIHTYNRHFYRDDSGQEGFAGVTKVKTDAGGMGGYDGYDRHKGPSWGGSDVDADLNWYFQLYTNGLMRSNSIYNSVTGFSNYYYALGGEMGSDGNSANFDMRKQPWSESDQGSGNASNDSSDWGNEIIGTNLRLPMSTNDTTQNGASNTNSSDSKWVANPYQGELFPDEDFAFWRDNGNLPNKSYVAASHNFSGLVADTSKINSESNRNHRFYRARFNENPLLLSRRELRMEGSGAASFMNGNNNPSADVTKGFNHVSAGTNGYLTKDPGEAGRRLADAFNLALPNTSPADRPFLLTGSGGSGGYNDPDIQALRNRLSFVNSATGVRSGTPSSSNVYYNHESSTTRTSSAIVQLSRDGAGNVALKGSVLMNGFARSQLGGDQTIARLSQAGSLQAYMDSGDTSNPGDAVGRTVQIPRVEIVAPKSSIITSNTSTVKFEVSWLRWDGEKYSPAYPDGWRDVTPLTFNAKYFDAKAIHPITGNPGVWIYVNTLDKASEKMDSNDLSYYDATHELFTGTSPESMSADKLTKTFSWDVSALDDGNYKLRVECYRDNFKKTGYTYHDTYITIKR